MVSESDILDRLRTINDPEMPINIVDLGIVERIELHPAQPGGIEIHVDILPTFVGCPALPVIENEIKQRLGELGDVAAVQVHITYSPPWSVDRITPAGREALRHFGVTVPEVGGEMPRSLLYALSAAHRPCGRRVPLVRRAAA